MFTAGIAHPLKRRPDHLGKRLLADAAVKAGEREFGEDTEMRALSSGHFEHGDDACGVLGGRPVHRWLGDGQAQWR